MAPSTILLLPQLGYKFKIDSVRSGINDWLAGRRHCYLRLVTQNMCALEICKIVLYENERYRVSDKISIHNTIKNEIQRFLGKQNKDVQKCILWRGDMINCHAYVEVGIRIIPRCIAVTLT